LVFDLGCSDFGRFALGIGLFWTWEDVWVCFLGLFEIGICVAAGLSGLVVFEIWKVLKGIVFARR